MASLNELAPTGKIMNSWHARRLPAWDPPLMTLKLGTGITYLSVGLPASSAMYWYSGIDLAAAPARATAMETERIALAPRFDLLYPHSFLEPSSASTIILSISACFVGSKPISLGPMVSLIFLTAVRHPFPKYRPLSPSRSSRASYAPVDAPEGQPARNMPFSVKRSTSTVGFPRLSKISRALTPVIPNAATRYAPKPSSAPPAASTQFDVAVPR